MCNLLSFDAILLLHECVSESSFFALHYYSLINVLDSAHAVFVRSTYLVCHRLISSWKSDLNTSLAALELLGGLARIQVPDQGMLSVTKID